MSSAPFGDIKQELPHPSLVKVENLPSVPLQSSGQPEEHAQPPLSMLPVPSLSAPMLDAMAVAQPMSISESISYSLSQPHDARLLSYATPPSPMPSRHSRPQPIRTLTEPAKFPQLQDFQNPTGYEFTQDLTPLSSSSSGNNNQQPLVTAPPQLPSPLDHAREAHALFVQFLMQAEVPSTPGVTGPRIFITPADMNARFEAFMDAYYGALSSVDPQRGMRKRHRQASGHENHISPKQIKPSTGYFDILAPTRPQPTQVSSSPIVPLSNDQHMHSIQSTASSLHHTQPTSTTISMFTGHPLVSAPPAGALNSVTPPRQPQSAASTDSRPLIQPFTPISPPNGMIPSQQPVTTLGSDPTSPAVCSQDPTLTLPQQEGIMASVAAAVQSQPASPRLFTNNIDLEMVRPSLSQPLPQQPHPDALNVLESMNSQISQQAFIPPIPTANGNRILTRPRSSSAATLASQVPPGLEMTKQVSFSPAPQYGGRGHHNKSISVDAAYDNALAAEQAMFMNRINGHHEAMASISVPNSPQQTIEFTEDSYAVNGIGDALRERMDMVLFDLLQTLCFDMDAADSAGEKIHQTQMPKKIARLEETADFRPFKFRIQAFTNRFIEELAANPATKGLDIPQKSVKQYLWNQPYICRYSEGGKKSKSKGNHIWTIEARKVSDAPWEFRPFERRIVTPACKNVRTGIRWNYEPKIFDPQAPQLQAEFSSSILPDWLSWRTKVVDSKNVVYLDGIPPADAIFPVSIMISALWDEDGKTAKLETTFDLNLEKSNSSSSMRGQALQPGVFATDVKI